MTMSKDNQVSQDKESNEPGTSLFRRLFGRPDSFQELSRKDRIRYEIKSWTLVILAVFFIRAGIIEAYQIPTGSMETTINVGDFLLGNKFIFGARTPDWVGIPFTRMGFDIPYKRLPALRQPRSGDVVIFRFPHDTWTKYVKRCIGAAGDTVEIIDKIPYVNGQAFQDPEHSIINYGHIYPADYQEANIFPRGNGNRDHYRALYVPRKGDTLRVNELNPDYIYNIMSLDGHEVTYSFSNFYVDGRLTENYVVEQDYFFMLGDNRDNSYDSRYWGLVPFKYVMGTPLVLYFSWDKQVPWSQFYKKIRWTRILSTVS